jgi:hypothetical protein
MKMKEGPSFQTLSKFLRLLRLLKKASTGQNKESNTVKPD